MVRRRRYALPKFPPGSAATFKSLSKAMALEEIPTLRERLEVAVNEMLSESQENRFLNPKIVEALADRSRFLLERYEELSKSQRAMAIGAIYYFAMEVDSGADGAFATGLDDDVAVMNYVLEELDIDDKFIEI